MGLIRDQERAMASHLVLALLTTEQARACPLITAGLVLQQQVRCPQFWSAADNLVPGLQVARELDVIIAFAQRPAGDVSVRQRH